MIWSIIFSNISDTLFNFVVDVSLWIRILLTMDVNQKMIHTWCHGKGGGGGGRGSLFLYNMRKKMADTVRHAFPAQFSAISKGREFTNRIIWKGGKLTIIQASVVQRLDSAIQLVLLILIRWIALTNVLNNRGQVFQVFYKGLKLIIIFFEKTHLVKISF